MTTTKTICEQYSDFQMQLLFQIFPGNTDRMTPKVNRLPTPVIAQYFRLIVETFSLHPTLRMDLLTCPLEETIIA